MNRLIAGFALAVTAGSMSVAVHAQQEGFFAGLKGFSEVPAVNSPGVGVFTALANSEGTALSYELRYFNTTGAVSQAHIHLGAAGTNGGVMVFLCTNLTAPPSVPTPPPCPGAGSVSGTLTAADVLALGEQGLSAGSFDDMLRAMRSGAGYANVHSTTFPAGELRGQVIAGP